MASVTLRPAVAEDEPFLRDLYASTRRDELAPLDWTEPQKRQFLDMQFNAQHRFYHTQFASASFEVVEHSGQPIGRLYLDRRSEEIRIIDIALLTEYRRKGLGSALLRDVLAEAGAAGKPVRIHVERVNPALLLYERLGFRKSADQGVYLLMEWAPTPENIGQTQLAREAAVSAK
jgi:ribosomal protein S18 acetylase RimI-like enzyme